MVANQKVQEMKNPAPGPRGAFESDLLGSSVNLENSQTCILTQVRFEYLLAEIRNAVLRLRLQENEVIAVGLGLKAGLMSCDAAIECLRNVGAPFFICGVPRDGGSE